MSAIKMEKNVRQSCGEKSRYIHIRFFFIKDVLARENIDIVHCPTERMIADYFTKPLQGSLFRKMRDIITGLALFPTEDLVGGEGSIAARNGASGTRSYVDIERAKR